MMWHKYSGDSEKLLYLWPQLLPEKMIPLKISKGEKVLGWGAGEAWGSFQAPLAPELDGWA